MELGVGVGGWVGEDGKEGDSPTPFVKSLLGLSVPPTLNPPHPHPQSNPIFAPWCSAESREEEEDGGRQSYSLRKQPTGAAG